jgi:hypothetical protein
MFAFCGRIIAVIFIFSLHFSLSYAGEAPPEIRKAADKGIQIFLKDPQLSGLHWLGIESQSDIDNATLGYGFQLFIVSSETILNESEPQVFQSLAIPTNLWQFLVLNGNKANVLLTVDLVDDKWTPVSIGASKLAKKFGKILEAWPVFLGYQYRFMRVFPGNMEFIELSQGDKVVGIIPLTTAQDQEFEPTDLRDTKEFLIKLRLAVKSNNQNEQ